MYIIIHKNKKFYFKKPLYHKPRKVHYFILYSKIFLLILFIFFGLKTLIFQNLNKIRPNDFIDNYLIHIPSKYEKYKKEERKRLVKFLSLEILRKNNKHMFYLELKSQLLKEFAKYGKKKIKEINSIFLTELVNFGNTMQILNNLIYYCEILECKNIFLSLNNNWFIKNKINVGQINIDIKHNSEINCSDIKILCFSLWSQFCLYPIVVKPELRINYIKDEIHKNLPKIKINQEDLYIFIRSGDIFENCNNPYFSQPPLCFYLKIIENFKFKNIHLISKTNNNPVINKLLSKFPNIIFKDNNLKEDLAYLVNAYNLVGATSSMLHASLIFNDNLKNYWEYNIYRYSEKYAHLHFDIYEYPNKFKIYRMNPSENYKNEFFVWKRTSEQLKLMIEEKCPNSFNVSFIK